MRSKHILFLCLALLPEVLFCQTKPIFHNKLSLQPPRDTAHLPKLPFRAISVLDGRHDESNAVGVYRVGKLSDFTGFSIPLYLDTTLGVAASKYLNRWYVEGRGTLSDSSALFIYLRKYMLFDHKVALGADVYVEKNGRYHRVLREDTLFRYHWRRYISGGALDFLIERVHSQWRKMSGRPGPEVSLKEITSRQEGLAWTHFPIVHTDSTLNGVFLSMRGLLQAKPMAISGVVNSITDSVYSWSPQYLSSWIPPGDTIYTITFSKESLKKYRWLRRWQRQRYAVASQNGALYLRFQKRTFVKLAKVGNTFAVHVPPQVVWAFLQTCVPGGGSMPSIPDTSFKAHFTTTPASPSVMGSMMASIADGINDRAADRDMIYAYDSCNFERGGWRFYVDMDLGAVICY